MVHHKIVAFELFEQKENQIKILKWLTSLVQISTPCAEKDDPDAMVKWMRDVKWSNKFILCYAFFGPKYTLMIFFPLKWLSSVFICYSSASINLHTTNQVYFFKKQENVRVKNTCLKKIIRSWEHTLTKNFNFKILLFTVCSVLKDFPFSYFRTKTVIVQNLQKNSFELFDGLFNAKSSCTYYCWLGVVGHEMSFQPKWSFPKKQLSDRFTY